VAEATKRYRLAAVFAHPDDDTFGVGGTLALHEGEVDATIIVATRGEAGIISEGSDATVESLGEVREREERAALATVGAGDADLHFLGYPDGGVKDVDREEMVGRIADVLRLARPQVVVTFGPEGVTKHEDHVAVGQACTEAFHRVQTEDPEGQAFRRLLYASIPQSSMDRWRRELQERDIDPGDPEAPFAPRGVPDQSIAVRVDGGRVWDRKLAALLKHRTQAQEIEGMPEDIRQRALSEETFVMAFPPPTEPDGPVLADVFEGLDR
jgi:LmbE family N-acetylglucosaminyl deacetylase